MLQVLIQIFRTASSISSSIWEFLALEPSYLYGQYIEPALNNFCIEIAYKVLQVGGGDRNPLTDLAYGFFDETIMTWVEWCISAPRVFFEEVLPYPMIAILFGGGLIVSLIWRLVSWIIDIFP